MDNEDITFLALLNSNGAILEPSSPEQLPRVKEHHFPNEYCLQVQLEMKPVEGQEFQTWEEALQFYNAYAAQAGFSTKIDGGKKKMDSDEWKWRSFTCSKEGRTNLCHQKKRENSEYSTVRRRGETRCDCKAKLNVIWNKNNSAYHVSLFKEYHSHPLSSPSKVHFLRSQRNVSRVVKSLVDDFDAANIPTSQQIRIMAQQAGGIQNMGYLEKDIRNYKRTRNENIKGYDAECLIE